MNKKTFLVLLILFCFLISHPPHRAHGEITGTKLVVIPKFIFPAEAYFTISVEVVNAYKVYAYQLYLNWSAPILNVTSITQGPFLTADGRYSTSFVQKKFNEQGYLLVGCTQTTADMRTAQSGNGTLVNLIFLVEKTGNTILHLYDTKLLDFYGASYTHTTEDGHVVNENPNEVIIFNDEYIKIIILGYAVAFPLNDKILGPKGKITYSK